MADETEIVLPQIWFWCDELECEADNLSSYNTVRRMVVADASTHIFLKV